MVRLPLRPVSKAVHPHLFYRSEAMLPYQISDPPLLRQ